MPGESSKRSNIVDVTYSELHTILLGHREGLTKDQITEIIRPRVDQLKNISEPFGKPSDASKKQLDSGSVTLSDLVLLRVDDIDKTAALAISDEFKIDQIQSLILFRAFIYNEGLQSDALSDSNTSFAEQLIDAITPFYFSERLHILRTLIPLFRADANESDFAYDFSQKFLPLICPEKGRTYVKSLIAEYQRKTQAALPSHTSGDPRAGSLWAKQYAKEQVVLLEVLFWAMWSRVTCDGPIVMRIFETAYETKLGREQQNSSYLLDQEGTQLQQDSAALWILITLEVLELEIVTDRAEISTNPDDSSIYTAYPESLQRIHELVTSHMDSQYACTYMAWTYVLSRLHRAANQLSELPENYRPFFSSVERTAVGAFSKDSLLLHELMSKACLEPEVGLLKFMLSMLTDSPLFVTGVALRTGSMITDPNNVAFRSVFKGLVMSLVELVPVEMIPEFEILVELWIALFGRSEPSSIEGICQQFWDHDSVDGISRRAIFDATRTRFPVQPRHLLRLLRAMTATGFLDTDPLSNADHSFEGQPPSELRMACTRHVYDYLENLSTFTQVIPINQCSGVHAVYEKLPERYNSSYGVVYTNLRPIKLPGGSVLPARSRGRVISGDTANFVVVSWQHQHSGWKVMLEILTDYARRRCTFYGSRDSSVPHTGQRAGGQPLALRLQDTGVEFDTTGDDVVVTDIFDLIRSVIQDNPVNAGTMSESLELGNPVVCHTTNEAPPDLVQLTTMILEETLCRSNQQRSPTRVKLITSALSVLASLLSLPEYSLRVWLYIRSTSSLFGTDRGVGFVPSVLASERAVGHYTMTLSLLHLVQQLFNQASSTLLVDEPKALQVKEEVLIRATKFVHAEIWVEHAGWKYVQLGDRFEIGRRVTSFYGDVFIHSPPNVKDRPFAMLSQAVVDALLYQASMSTINPLVSSLTTAGSVIGTLYASRRHGDARRLIYLLESHLRLARLILTCKEKSPFADKTCLLEQVLCGKVTGGAASVDIGRSKLDPIDVLATYVTERRLGLVVPAEAMRVLHALCSSLSTCQPSPPTLVGHLCNPEATVSSLVRIVQHPYDELSLRIAVWNFISLAVDKEPALGGLFVTGQFQTPSAKGKEKAVGPETANAEPQSSKPVSAVGIATTMLEGWKELWDANSKLLACVLNFLSVVWEHGLEHRVALYPLRKDTKFWECLALCAREELGPLPDYVTQTYVVGEGGYQRSDLHEAVSSHAYRTVAKSHALHIIGLDISIFARRSDNSISLEKPTSYLAIEPIFNSEEDLSDYILEAATTPYDPALYDDIMEEIRSRLPALTLEQLQIQDPFVEREFGDNFSFSRQLLNCRLRLDDVEAENLDLKLTSINLNLSLTHAQTSLTDSWQHLLLQIIAYVRGNSAIRTHVLNLVASLSSDISTEKRSGDMMATLHGKRLSLLLSLLEVAWFSTTDKKEEVGQFICLVKNVHGIILSETQSPVKSFLGKVTIPFHRTLLQIIYFCTRQCRSLSRRAKVLTAEQRLTVTAMLEAALNLVINALHVVFDSARVRLDLELDQDLELLVAVFELCTRPDVNSSSVLWLTRCQETNVIRASLDLFAHIDLVGLSDLSILRSHRQPLYAPHILTFHMALASLPSAAERLATEGVLVAYGDNSMSSVIRAGMIDVTIPELPGERNPAHKAYCTMLAIVASVATSLGRQNQFFGADASGFVQLYGHQISRALSWSIGDPLTLPYLEELEQVVNIFHAIARNLPLLSKPSENVTRVLRGFTTHALSLIQQLNYALTHPNHLASLLEPVTMEEKTLIEKDRSSSFQSSAELIDPMKRPFLTRLIHRLFKLTSGIISTLTDVSGAEKVLIGEQEDWPLHEAFVVPHSKVVLGEPASMGTLLELGNCTLDILRLLIDHPPGQAITPGGNKPTYEKPLDVRDAVAVTRQNLEVVGVYAVAQLAMWLSKPEFDTTSAAGAEMDTDDQSPEHLKGIDSVGGTKDRRGNRRVSSVNLADRLRRGMTGEMASDLQALLIKAKSAFAKSKEVLSTPDTVDIIDVLCHFLQERVLAL